MDVQIVDALAQAHPDWQIVIVGPVVKIDPATLPSHPNLHFVGPSSYADLPSYLAGWDVCLLPFALNESTMFISPTKTLEYLAADKPIVSTPITDVAEPYGGDRRIWAARLRSLLPPASKHCRPRTRSALGVARRAARCWHAPPGSKQLPL